MASDRAIVFDLDDTLYPYRLFVMSGFDAVAAELQRERGVPAGATIETLRAAYLTTRGQELQRLCERFDLPESLIPSLVALIHRHRPTLQLPKQSAHVLRVLRPWWRMGVLTNGISAVQARKVAALGLERYVDAVVCATDCGDGRGKPAADGFVEILDRLGARSDRAVFVGNDPEADVAGAARVGMRTIHLDDTRFPGGEAVRSDARVTCLADVPGVAARLVPAKEAVHVV